MKGKFEVQKYCSEACSMSELHFVGYSTELLPGLVTTAERLGRSTNPYIFHTYDMLRDCDTKLSTKFSSVVGNFACFFPSGQAHDGLFFSQFSKTFYWSIKRSIKHENSYLFSCLFEFFHI